MKKIKILSILCLFFIFYLCFEIFAKPVLAPQAQDKPIILGAAADYNGEIDLKWLNIGSSNDSIFIADTISHVVYCIYRKAETDFISVDSVTVMMSGIFVDTIYQRAVNGQPSPAITFWSDTTQNRFNNIKYYYSIIAYDRFDGVFSNASGTVAIVCDTQGPELISLYGATPKHQDYITKSLIPITVTVYENTELKDGNLFLNYGFTSDTLNLSSLTGINSAPMSVVTAETQGFYRVTGYIPAYAGNDTSIFYWISGSDNANGLSDEQIDYSIDGNIRTSVISGKTLMDSSSACVVYIDAASPSLISVDAPDSYNGYVKGVTDTFVIVSVTDNLYINTGTLILHYKKLNGLEYSIPMGYNGTRTNGQFFAALPVPLFADGDIIKYWITGGDKAGNAITAADFNSEITSKSITVDSAGPVFISAQIYNSSTDLPDLSFSCNPTADSSYYFKVEVSDSIDIDSVYLKFYSRETNIDITNYLTGSSVKYFSKISGDTLWMTSPENFLNDSNVFPVFFGRDRFGNISIYSDTMYSSATQNYTYNSKTFRIFSIKPAVTTIIHINNDYADSNTELSAGDSLVFIFNNNINTTTVSIIENAIVNDNGRTLGSVTEYKLNYDSNTFIITIPTDFNFINGDTFHFAVSVLDIYGNSGDTYTQKNIYDSAAPIIKNVYFTNSDTTSLNSTIFTRGDTITFIFSEAINTSSIGSGLISNLQTKIFINGSSSKTFGSSGTLVWVDSKTLNFSLGSSFTLSDGDYVSLSNMPYI